MEGKIVYASKYKREATFPAQLLVNCLIKIHSVLFTHSGHMARWLAMTGTGIPERVNTDLLSYPVCFPENMARGTGYKTHGALYHQITRNPGNCFLPCRTKEVAEEHVGSTFQRFHFCFHNDFNIVGDLIPHNGRQLYSVVRQLYNER